MAHDRENGKCYFGSTFQTLKERIYQHENYAKKNRSSGHFYRALAKRPEKFFWMVVDTAVIDLDQQDSRSSKAEDRQLEEDWIKKYWGQDWLYNQKDSATGFAPGSNNPNQTPEWKEHISKLFTGSNNPMVGNGHLVAGERNGMYGTKPWNTPMAKDNPVWANAISIYNLYKESQHKTYGHLSDAYNKKYNASIKSTKFCHIHKMLKSGWNPIEDSDWCLFIKDIV